jgi:hypothetical protein
MADGTQINGEYFHQQSHKGGLFEFYYENALLPAGPTYFMIATGNLPLHVNITLEGTGLITFATYRNPVVSVNGSAWVPNYYNDIVNIIPLTTGYIGPTVTSTGYLISTKSVFGYAQVNSRISSLYASGVEQLWRPNTNYLFNVTTADTTPRFRLSINCYEGNI